AVVRTRTEARGAKRLDTPWWYLSVCPELFVRRQRHYCRSLRRKTRCWVGWGATPAVSALLNPQWCQWWSMAALTAAAMAAWRSAWYACPRGARRARIRVSAVVSTREHCDRFRKHVGITVAKPASLPPMLIVTRSVSGCTHWIWGGSP